MSTQTELAAAQLNEGQDRRQLFVGYWDCVGTKSTKGIGEEPYHAHMHNLWTLQNVWLLIQFQEYQPTAGKPFAEDQYWGFSDNPVKHTRPMMTTGNGFGVVTSSGWEGDTSQWTGTYSVGEITFDLTETITILDHNKIQWGGKIILGGEVVGTYDLLCTRQNQGHNGNMPTA
ncbi:MAG TPA: hypothetical protein VFZ66_11710 [Herpetosiphonaceae bacterium]